MGLTKEQTAGYRQSRILQMVSRPGGATSYELAKHFKVGRGQIIQDVKELRAKRYPIQSSSMTTEGGMYVVRFELTRIPEESSKSTPAASAERPQKSTKHGARSAPRQEEECATYAASTASITDHGPEYGDANTSPKTQSDRR